MTSPYLSYLAQSSGAGVVNPLVYEAGDAIKDAAETGTNWAVTASVGLLGALAFYVLVAKVFRT